MKANSGIEIGKLVVVQISRPKTWTAEHVAAFNGLAGVVEEAKENTSKDPRWPSDPPSFLVRFAVTPTVRGREVPAFHFERADLLVAG